MKIPRSSSAVMGLGVGSCLVAILITACDTWPKSHLKIPPVSPEAYEQHKLNVESKKGILQPVCVAIQGQDIQLPLTAGNSDPQENRAYSFYVWAYDPDAPTTKSLEEMREDGAFSLEILGAKASIRQPDFLPASGPPEQVRFGITNAVKSRSVLEVRVRSQDIAGPFTIVAWFPEKYRKWQQDRATTAPPYLGTNHDRLLHPELLSDTAVSLKNPYGEKREVKVYNGDLRTRIEIVSEREAQASFGTLFAKHFYVGRVFLRNRHPDKDLVVYTTSLKANLLFYRPPVKEKHQQKALTDMQYTVLTNRLEEQNGPARTNLSESEITAVLDEALRQIPRALSDGPARWPHLATDVTAKAIPSGSPNSGAKRAEACPKVMTFWDLVQRTADEYEKRAKDLHHEAQKLLEFSNASAPGPQPTEAPDNNWDYPTVLQLIADSADAALTANYAVATNTIIRAAPSPAERARVLELAHQVYDSSYRSAAAGRMAVALQANAPRGLLAMPPRADTGQGPVELQHEFEQTLVALRFQAGGFENQRFNPFAKNRDLLINPNGRVLGFSESADRQVGLDNVGYLWRDTYRPMTFQSVLNSLIFTHENSYSERTVRILQSVAVLAGGMVGLGSVINEFNSQGYLTAVNLFSTIVVPEVGKLILDDLNKHIRNLGEMGMDTIVVVHPNDVTDRYIFFPKGPIYNFVDEFDVDTPTYIKDIDNDDVAVEATLVDHGVNVQGGGLDSATLVARALNEGQLETSATLTKQADLRDKLRKLQLDQLESDIKTILARAPADDTSGQKSTARAMAEKEVCQRVKRFQNTYGEDFTGVIPSLLVQYGVDCDSAPPRVNLNSRPTINILGGVLSQKFTLPVDDVMGAWTLKITNFTSNPDFLPPTNISIVMPGANTTAPVQFTLMAAPEAGRDGTTTTEITFAISNAMNLATNLTLPVTIHQPLFAIGPTEDAKLNQDGLTLAGRQAFIPVSFPIYNSDPTLGAANWVFEPGDNQAIRTNGWLIALSAPQSNFTPSGGTTFQFTLMIDPSLSESNQAPFTLTARYGTNVITSTNLTAVLPQINR